MENLQNELKRCITGVSGISSFRQQIRYLGWGLKAVLKPSILRLVTFSQRSDQAIQHLLGFDNLWFYHCWILVAQEPQAFRQTYLIMQFPKGSESHGEESKVIWLAVPCATFHDVGRNWNSCPPDLRSQSVQLFSRKSWGHLIDQYC